MDEKPNTYAGFYKREAVSTTLKKSSIDITFQRVN